MSKMKKLYEDMLEIGLEISTDRVANMVVDTIVVPDVAIKAILKTIQLNPEVQEEAFDKLLERTPLYNQLTPEEQVAKITATLTMETVIEFLRLTDYIKEHVDMVETGINDEGSIVVTVFYIAKDEAAQKLFNEEMTEQQAREMETQVNLFEQEFNLVEEAKKRIEQMKNVVPFQNREQRRRVKTRRGATT